MKTYRFGGVLLMAGVLGLFGAACEKDTNLAHAASLLTEIKGDTISQADRDFLKDADKSNLKEQTMARMAIENSRSDEVKDFARMMDNDHTKTLEEIIDLMNRKEVAQPTDLNDARREAERQASSVAGATYDRAFVNAMVQDHQEMIDTFKMEANTAQDEDIRSFAKNTLPMLGEHLKKAMELQTKLSGT